MINLVDFLLRIKWQVWDGVWWLYLGFVVSTTTSSSPGYCISSVNLSRTICRFLPVTMIGTPLIVTPEALMKTLHTDSGILQVILIAHVHSVNGRENERLIRFCLKTSIVNTNTINTRQIQA